MDYTVFPVFRSILFPQMIFGIPRNLFIFFGTLTLSIVVSMHQYWFIIPAILILFGLSRLTKIDIYFYSILFDLFKFQGVAD